MRTSSPASGQFGEDDVQSACEPPPHSSSTYRSGQRHAGRIAIVDSQGAYTYDDLLDASASVATALLTGRDDLREERVAFLIMPGFAWVAVLWGIWRAGGIAVPLPLGSAKPELEYFIEDTTAVDGGV